MADARTVMDHLEEARQALVQADRSRPPLGRAESRLFDIYTGEAMEALRELAELVWDEPSPAGSPATRSPATSSPARAPRGQQAGDQVGDQLGDELEPNQGIGVQQQPQQGPIPGRRQKPQ